MPSQFRRALGGHRHVNTLATWRPTMPSDPTAEAGHPFGTNTISDAFAAKIARGDFHVSDTAALTPAPAPVCPTKEED